MKNANISRVLKYYRKLNKLSVAEVSGILEQDHIFVAEKTIYGWESGQTQPDADTLLKLCRIYHIEDILPAFGYLDPEANANLHLTEFEARLIRNYREKEEMQSAVKRLLDLDTISDFHKNPPMAGEIKKDNHN